jgi:hypothetical protein
MANDPTARVQSGLSCSGSGSGSRSRSSVGVAFGLVVAVGVEVGVAVGVEVRVAIAFAFVGSSPYGLKRPACFARSRDSRGACGSDRSRSSPMMS